jgi:hypothetical protein
VTVSRFLWLELVLAAARITRLTPLVGFHISFETTEWMEDSDLIAAYLDHIDGKPTRFI